MTAVESVTSHKLVLLIEDNLDALEMYANALREGGYYVIEAQTVEDAKGAVRALCPDVVVLDCRLPDGDGLALLAAWRKTELAIANVPVIVVSASAYRQDVEAALLAGADQFVPKPCPGNVLTMHVTRALDRSKPSARLRRVTVV